MASSFYDGSGGAPRRSGIDLPVAALAALSVGFVAFAMPADQFADAISATGLPSLLPAAAPPLGTTARALAVALASIATFGLVLTLLRLLDRRPAEPERRPVRGRSMFDEDGESGPPRLRRADSHPDAPARRPILAARELGEPDFAPPHEARERAQAPVPDFEFPLPPPEPEIFASAAPLAAPAPASEPDPAPAPAAPTQPGEDSSIPDLVARLERGLGRRQQPAVQPPAPAPAARPAPVPSPSPAAAERDDRLRSAIEELQRLASRG